MLKLIRKKFMTLSNQVTSDLVDTNQIVTFEKFKHYDKVSKYFISYEEGNIITLLCIVLPEMSPYIKKFENGEKICLI